MMSEPDQPERSARFLEAIGVTGPRKEKLGILRKRAATTWRIYSRNRFGMAGLLILFVFAFIAIFAAQISVAPGGGSNRFIRPLSSTG